MNTISISEIVDDLRAADEITRRFERRYWLSSADFYTLYQQGILDDGENLEDMTLWASYYQIKLAREKELQALSQRRLSQLQQQEDGIVLTSTEPMLAVSAD